MISQEESMRTPRWLESDVHYAKNLVGAGLDGVTSAWKRPGEPRLRTASKSALWMPVAIGAAIGAFGSSLRTPHRLGHRTAIGGLVGGALGLGASVAWSSRSFTGALVRSTVHQVNAARDAHWLEKNPVAYG